MDANGIALATDSGNYLILCMSALEILIYIYLSEVICCTLAFISTKAFYYYILFRTGNLSEDFLDKLKRADSRYEYVNVIELVDTQLAIHIKYAHSVVKDGISILGQ